MIQQYSRWILLSWTFTFRLICQPLKKLYPDLQSLQNAGKENLLYIFKEYAETCLFR